MFNARTTAIIKRELKALMLNKTFIIMTVLMPLLFMSGFLVVGLMNVLNVVDKAHVVIVEEEPFVNDLLREVMEENDEVRSGAITVEYRTMDRGQLDMFVDQNRTGLLKDSIAGVFFIPAKAKSKKHIEFYSANPNNLVLTSRVSDGVNKALTTLRFEGRGIAEEDVAFAQGRTKIDSYKVSAGEDVSEEDGGGVIVSFIVSFLLYISLFINGMQLLRSVTQEKTSRIVEVLLSSVNPRELMTAKVVGTAITGLVQMLIWFSPILMLSMVQLTVLPDDIADKVGRVLASINPGLMLYVIVNFLMGIMTFLSMFAALGAMFDNDQDAQQGMWPIVMLILVPFFIAMSISMNPSSELAVISSMLPISSIMVMPARMALSDVPLWQSGLTLVVNFVVLIGILRLAGKIYRVRILSSGSKVTLKKVWGWMTAEA